MRGLTKEERYALQLQRDGVEVEASWDDSLSACRYALKGRGLSRIAWANTFVEKFAITDLGRLALRVCPAGEE